MAHAQDISNLALLSENDIIVFANLLYISWFRGKCADVDKIDLYRHDPGELIHDAMLYLNMDRESRVIAEAVAGRIFFALGTY